MTTRTLRILREVSNYTQEFVAEDILGISQNTYSRREQNPDKITAEQAQKHTQCLHQLDKKRTGPIER